MLTLPLFGIVFIIVVIATVNAAATGFAVSAPIFKHIRFDFA